MLPQCLRNSIYVIVIPEVGVCPVRSAAAAVLLIMSSKLFVVSSPPINNLHVSTRLSMALFIGTFFILFDREVMFDAMKKFIAYGTRVIRVVVYHQLSVNYSCDGVRWFVVQEEQVL